jgi:hypothetical protein
MAEKADFTTEADAPPYEGQTSPVADRKHSTIGEAADIYGDINAAEEYGYVQRGLKSRHIQFIALGGTIGTGLFLGIGRALSQAGPLSILLGYSATGLAVYAMMQSLGEMATWLPLPGAIPQFCARYVDPAVGFAVGWNVSWPPPDPHAGLGRLTGCRTGTRPPSRSAPRSRPPRSSSASGRARPTSTWPRGSASSSSSSSP